MKAGTQRAGQFSEELAPWRRPVTAGKIASHAFSVSLTCQAPSRGDGRVCGGGLGESTVQLRLVGVFKRWDDRSAVPRPRDVRRCRKCGWYTVSEPVLDKMPGEA